MSRARQVIVATLLASGLVVLGGCATAPRDPRTREEIAADVRATVAEIVSYFGEDIVDDYESKWGLCDPAWDDSGESYSNWVTVRTEYTTRDQVMDVLWSKIEAAGWRLGKGSSDPSQLTILRDEDEVVAVYFSGGEQEGDTVAVSASVDCVRAADY